MNVERMMHQRVWIYYWNQDATDEYGTPTSDWSQDPAERKGFVQQTEAREVTVNRETLISEHLLGLPESESRIGGRDLVQDADGAMYEVVGRPERCRTTRGVVTHVEARLRLLDL